MSGSLPMRGCTVASAALMSTSGYTELSPSTGARRSKYLYAAGRPPLLENVNQRNVGKCVCRGGKVSAFAKFIAQPCYSPPVVAVTPVGLLQPFDPVVALLRRPQVSNGGHLLRYLGEDVAVADAGFQAMLHVVCRPHLNESHRLLLRPCCVHTLYTYVRWMKTL